VETLNPTPRGKVRPAPIGTLPAARGSETPLATLAAGINAAHARCEAAATDAVRSAIEAGRLLLVAKEKVPHGGWLPWLTANCPFSMRLAQSYMKLARETTDPEKRHAVAHLPLRKALSVLAKPKPRSDYDFDGLGLGGKLLAGESEDGGAAAADCIPPPGHWLTGVVEDDDSHLVASIQPADGHAGFHYVSTVYTDKRSPGSGAHVEGTARPVRGDAIPAVLTVLNFAPGTAKWSSDPAEPVPYNMYLFDSHQDYVERAILGRRATVASS
jgi:hypothetical protein